MALHGIRTKDGVVMNETVFCDDCGELESMAYDNALSAEDHGFDPKFWNPEFEIIKNEDDAKCQGCGVTE